MHAVSSKFDDLLSGYLATIALCTGVELGIFDALAQRARTAEETAQFLHIDPRGTDILLHALCALNLLQKEGNIFTLTELSSMFLARDSPSYAGHKARLVSFMHERSLSLPHVLRTGRPLTVPPLSQQEAQHRLRTCVRAMAEISVEFIDTVADAIELSAVIRMLDIGGGPGTYAFEIVRRKPNVKAVIIDRLAVVEITRELIEVNNMQQSVTATEGDFLTDEIGTGYDLILMSNVLHEYSPSENTHLIQKAYNAMNRGAQLVINELVLNPGRASPAHAAVFALQMLMNTQGGRTYTKAEIISWMGIAGVTDFRTVEKRAGNCVIIGRKSL